MLLQLLKLENKVAIEATISYAHVSYSETGFGSEVAGQESSLSDA